MDQDQPAPFTAEQYAKLNAMLNKHDLETTPSTPKEASSAAMLAGKIFYFSASTLDLKWIIDSGATDHITPNLHCFSSYTPLVQDSFITMPNGKQAKIHHTGNIQLTSSLSLCNALHVLDFHYNLLSASRLAKTLSAHVVFTPTSCYIQDPLMRQYLEFGRETGGLYFVDHLSCVSNMANSHIPSQPQSSPSSSTLMFSLSCQMSPLELWHCGMGHMPFNYMKYIDVLSSCISKPKSICQVCHQARQHRSPSSVSTSCTSHIFEMMHVDLRGPYANSTYNGYKYFITIIDDYMSCLTNQMFFPFSNPASLSLMHNSRLKFKSFDLIMDRSFLILLPLLSMLL